MKIKILITGASGFVGRHVTAGLAANENFTLYALSRDPDKARFSLGGDIHIYKGDITSPDSLKDALVDKDMIIHCAALMSNFDTEPREKFYDVNVRGTENLLNACDTGTLKQFVHISTVGVYGATGNLPANEDTPYGKGLSDYEWSKMKAELAVMSFAGEKNMACTILRPSQLYGADMRYGWPESAKSIRAGRMLIPGGGTAKIHLLNIEDLVTAVRLITLNSKAMNKIYNIAGPEILSLADVFNMLADILNAKRPGNVPYPAVYMASILLTLVPYAMKSEALRLLTPHRVRFFAQDHAYDITKARREIKYSPAVIAQDGFREMAAWLD